MVNPSNYGIFNGNENLFLTKADKFADHLLHATFDMSEIIYQLLKFYVWASTRFYFNKVRVLGKENVKGDGPFLFVANHQNAFMDGLLIVTINRVPVHFLIRADIFKKKLAAKMLRILKLMPVYRIRDGAENLHKNEEQFNECVRLFRNKESVLIFPEGNHGHTRKLRPLSKGFTRIVFEAQRQHPEMNLQVVPTGINYSNHTAFNSRVSIYYGKPIPASEYYKEPLTVQTNLFRERMALELKKLMTHIDDEVRYEEILTKLNASNPDYFDPNETNQRIEKITRGEAVAHTERKTPLFNIITTPLKPLAWLINWPVALGWRKFIKKIKDPVFVGSLKFGYGIFVVHVYYVLLMAIASVFIGWWALLVYPSLLLTLKILRKPV
jgi:1-acyl-sn-glycerol-3-phosphate acyltransferase